MSEDVIVVEGYLTIVGKRYKWSYKPNITSGRIARATVNKPAVLHKDEIAVKVKMVVPLSCFEPLNQTDAGMVQVPSHHILSPAFFTEAPDEDEGEDS